MRTDRRIWRCSQRRPECSACGGRSVLRCQGSMRSTVPTRLIVWSNDAIRPMPVLSAWRRDTPRRSRRDRSRRPRFARSSTGSTVITVRIASSDRIDVATVPAGLCRTTRARRRSRRRSDRRDTALAPTRARSVGPCGHLCGVTGEVSYEDVCVDEGTHRRVPHGPPASCGSRRPTRRCGEKPAR